MNTNLENTNHLTTSEYRKTYFETNKTLIFPYACMELMDEYFEIKRDRFLKDAKEQLQANYNQKNEIKIFIKKEIKEFKDYRNQKKEAIQNPILEKTREKVSLKQKRYINFLKEQLSKLEQLNDINTELTKEPQQDENIFCKTMPLNIPKEHFKTLTLKNSKNGLPYLTQNQFDDFINRAFLGKVNLPKQKFNQAPKGEKFKIQYLFRQFYENYCFEYFNTGQTQDVFIELLTENFIGWDFENVKDNFKTKPKKLI